MDDGAVRACAGDGVEAGVAKIAAGRTELPELLDRDQ
jgi:hypothetical protein